MSKYFLVSVLALLAFFMSACSSTESDTEGKKPTRQSDSGQLPWAKPASWEGGMPGMPSTSGRSSQY